MKSEFVKLKIMRIVGNVLILFAVLGLVATFGPALFYEVRFRLERIRGVKYVVVDPTRPTELGRLLQKYKLSNPSLLAKVAAGVNEKIITPPDTNFSIIIPKIGVSERVFANTDPSNPDYFLPVLKKGIAHARGSVFPGMNGAVYLFAHSTDNFWNVGRYNAAFYLIKDLSPGDEIIVFFQNRRFEYRVVESRITDASDTSYISSRGEEMLVLQTCWPPGTTWKRLLVFAK
jgi:sortase A